MGCGVVVAAVVLFVVFECVLFIGRCCCFVLHSKLFHIGVMRTDGKNERLLTASFLDEGPSWSPNGRVIMFFRETAGANGAPEIYSVDVTGRNLKRVKTPSSGSDPAWSGLLK